MHKGLPQLATRRVFHARHFVEVEMFPTVTDATSDLPALATFQRAFPCDLLIRIGISRTR